jgi:hypothetical protein
MTDLWTTAHGGWGDCIASYGNIRALLRDKNQNEANVIFFGMDATIVEFLKAQKNIGKVRHLRISDPSEYYDYSLMGILDFPLFTRMTGLHDLYPDLIPTHISHFYQSENQTLCNRDFDVVLPPSKLCWDEILPQEPFLLLQPYSCYSCKLFEHWPFWFDAIKFVIENSNLKVVLVGELNSIYDTSFQFPWIEHPNLINLVGQTPSMIDVFHIMAKSKGLITTSNGLSIWSIPSNKPSLVVCNKVIHSTPVMYYYNWINHKPNTVMRVESSLSDFVSEAEAFIKRIEQS